MVTAFRGKYPHLGDRQVSAISEECSPMEAHSTAEELTCFAYHEAAHTIVGIHAGYVLQRVCLDDTTFVPVEGGRIRCLDDAAAHGRVVAAGWVSELIREQEADPYNGDLTTENLAYAAALRMDPDSEELMWVADEWAGSNPLPWIEAAEQMLRTRWHEVELIARALLCIGELSGDDVDRLLGRAAA